jgi:molybdenum cofactor cytidylyltransferase
MNLLTALRLENAFCLAAVGAGGKTTALFDLARELHPPVVITTTTHFHKKQIDLVNFHYVINETATFEKIFSKPRGLILISGSIVNDRVTGLDDGLINILHEYCRGKYPLLIEADGSRQRPLKAPAPYEPVVPSFVDTVLVVVGMDALGKPLSTNHVHRPEIFSQITKLSLGDKVTLESVLNYLVDKNGGLKGIPLGAKRVALLNHSGPFAISQAVSQQLLLYYDAILTASLKQPLCASRSQVSVGALHEPVSAIILAAGEAKRFGRLKQLINWSGKPMIRHIVETTLRSNVSEVILVTGAGCEKVETAVEGLPIIIKRNPDWKEGVSTSIRTGLQASSSKSGAAVFILADQPYLSSSLIDKLINLHSLELPPIVVPQVLSQSANPVLFDKRTFPDLLTLGGDIGGKQLFSRYQVSFIPWEDERLCMDIDTVDDYNKLRLS